MGEKLTWAAWMPIPSAILCWGWFKGLFCRPATRAEAKGRQAGIRREMRGLPAEHEEGGPRS